MVSTLGVEKVPMTSWVPKEIGVKGPLSEVVPDVGKPSRVRSSNVTLNPQRGPVYVRTDNGHDGVLFTTRHTRLIIESELCGPFPVWVLTSESTGTMSRG